MKQELIKLYLLGQTLDHPSRLEIKKQFRLWNKTNPHNKFTFNDIFEYMYPAYYTHMDNSLPDFKFINQNLTTLINAYNLPYTHHQGITAYGAVRYLDVFDWYLTNLPNTSFRHIAGSDILFTPTKNAIPNWAGHFNYTFTPANTGLVLPFASINSSPYSYIESV